MLCPVCKTQLKIGVTKCPTCKFADIRSEFINQDEVDFWMDTIVMPYKIEYEKPKADIVVEMGDIVTTDDGVFIINPVVEPKHIKFIDKTIGDSVRLSLGNSTIVDIRKSGKKPMKSNEELLKDKNKYLREARESEAETSKPILRVENGDKVITSDGRTFNVNLDEFPIQKDTLIGKKIGDTFEVVGKTLTIEIIEKNPRNDTMLSDGYKINTKSDTIEGFFRSNGFNVIDGSSGKLWVEEGPHLDECVEKACQVFNISGWYTRGRHTGYRRFWVTRAKSKKLVKSYKSAYTSARTIIDYLEHSNIEYIDKRDQDGALWIIGGQELETAVKDIKKKFGAEFKYTSQGSHTTKRKPAWWTKSEK